MLITLVDFKNYIGLDGTDDDETIKLYIQTVNDFILEYVCRVIEETEDITETFDGDDVKDTIFLSDYPIKENTLELTYKNGDTWITYQDKNVNLDLNTGIIYVDEFHPGIQNIKASYTAGYKAADIPNPIKLAALKLVAKIYNKSHSDGFKSETMSQASISWDSFVSDDIATLLSPYQRIQI